jgi:hypothetical protein
MDEAVQVKHCLRIRPIQPPTLAFAGFRFPPEAILIAVGSVALMDRQPRANQPRRR